MINTKKDRENLYLKLSDMDVLSKLQKFLKRGGYHINTSGKIVPHVPALSWDVPWVYVKMRPMMRCDIGHHILWEYFKIISSTCRQCYKVVVRPRNLKELFDLYELEKELDVPSKCGIELRRTVMGLYGGYFYNDGLQEGKERYKQVREAVNDKLSPETSVILKRYCTEFEIDKNGKGPSDKLPDLTEKEKYIEQMITSIIPDHMHNTEIPEFMVAHVMRKWIHFAYQNGDETYKEFTGGNPLFPSTVTYHDKQQED